MEAQKHNVIGKTRKLLEGKPNFYVILGVPIDADLDQLRGARNYLAKVLHPDMCKAPDAHDLMAAVNDAYATLSEPKLRKKYDALYRLSAVCTTCQGEKKVVKMKGFKPIWVSCPACGE